MAQEKQVDTSLDQEPIQDTASAAANLSKFTFSLPIVLVIVFLTLAFGLVVGCLYGKSKLPTAEELPTAATPATTPTIPNNQPSVEPPTSVPTPEPDPTAGWEKVTFETVNEKYGISYPKDWKIEYEYGPEELYSGGVATVNISKDRYFFKAYFPSAFGMDMCFVPGDPPAEPFYNGDTTSYDFGTLKEYDSIASEYGNYVRGKVPLPLGGKPAAPSGTYYVRTCSDYDNGGVRHGAIEMGFIDFIYPTAEPEKSYVKTMDEILKTYHLLVGN